MKTLLISAVFIIAGALLGCTAKEIAQAPAPALETKVQTNLEVRPAWQEKWDKVLAAARKEGRVSVISMGGGRLRDDVTEAFEKRFGIKVEMTTMGGSQLGVRVITERRAGIYTWDVFQGSTTTPINVLKPAGSFAPLEPILIRPDILDPKNWNPGHPSWIDKDRLLLNVEYSVSGIFGINTNLVKPGEIKSLRDLLNPKWKGKMMITDPTVSGGGAKLVGAVAFKHGWDIWREIAKQEPMVIKDDRLQVVWLAQGKYAVNIATDTATTFEAMQSGAPVKNISVEEGRYTTGHSVALFNNALHPNAAIVYINWLLSQEGQTVYNGSQGGWSARTDVILDSDPSKKPEPGVIYFDSNNEEFVLAQPEQMKMAQEIFGYLKN